MRTALRDLSLAHFRAAYRRAGWTAQLAWFSHERHPSRHIGCVLDPTTYRLHRRATLAHLSRELSRMDKAARAAKEV